MSLEVFLFWFPSQAGKQFEFILEGVPGPDYVSRGFPVGGELVQGGLSSGEQSGSSAQVCQCSNSCELIGLWVSLGCEPGQRTASMDHPKDVGSVGSWSFSRRRSGP
eukprot:16450562-Heterocapsa_arctica.AAC.1